MSTETCGRIGSEVSAANQPREIPAQRRRLSGDGASSKVSRCHRRDVAPQRCPAYVIGRFDVLSCNPFNELIDITSVGAQGRGRHGGERRLKLVEKPRICFASHKQNCNGEH